MEYYHNNTTDTTASNVGLLPFPPYYWWQSGAMWGGMVDYYAYTNDSSYVASTIQALMAQQGSNHDFIMVEQEFDEVS
jgi:mannan endo-1,6-alpha-mannosidase